MRLDNRRTLILDAIILKLRMKRQKCAFVSLHHSFIRLLRNTGPKSAACVKYDQVQGSSK